MFSKRIILQMQTTQMCRPLFLPRLCFFCCLNKHRNIESKICQHVVSIKYCILHQYYTCEIYAEKKTSNNSVRCLFKLDWTITRDERYVGGFNVITLVNKNMYKQKKFAFLIIQHTSALLRDRSTDRPVQER